ncbi:MAG: antibiotic biosynthesis monooxygenase [Pseudomonadota bacterium]
MNRTDSSLFRVDKFIVPASARVPFLTAIEAIHHLIGAQPGCVQNHVLEQVGGPGEFNFVSVVEWASDDAMVCARGVIEAHQAQSGIDPQRFRDKQGIRADVGTYQPVPWSTVPSALR